MLFHKYFKAVDVLISDKMGENLKVEFGLRE
jgi:hypothetical protein